MRTTRVLRGVRDRVVARLVPYLRRHPRHLARLLEAVRLVPHEASRARLYRSFSWPLVQEIDVRLTVATPGGSMEVDTGDAVGRVVAVSGIWEPNATAIVRRVLAPGDVFVDLGAHTGYYTLLASHIVGAEGHVFAFEPSPARYLELLANLSRSTMRNVSAFSVAAGSGDGTATLYEAPRPNTSASTLSAGALARPAVATRDEFRPVEVMVAAADSLLPTDLFERVRVVKVDVEGYEVEAIQGLERLLASGAPLAVLVEVSPAWTGEGSVWVERLCARHGLEPWLVSNEYTLTGYFPARLQPPVPLAAIPHDRCDLLLVRGIETAVVAGAAGVSL